LKLPARLLSEFYNGPKLGYKNGPQIDLRLRLRIIDSDMRAVYVEDGDHMARRIEPGLTSTTRASRRGNAVLAYAAYANRGYTYAALHDHSIGIEARHDVRVNNFRLWT